VYVHSNPQRAWDFLNSIPAPVAKSIEGRLSDYYMLKGMLYHKSGEQAKLFNSFILAIKYGEKEKNYGVAGQASLDLFSNIYVVKKDSSAYKYLEDAKKYFTLANDKNGLIEVTQMPAYVAFQNHEYEKSNALLLKNMDLYKNAEDDAYYYLFANFILADNYIHLDDLANANKYLHTFQSLEKNPTIDPYNYRAYATNLNICMASIHLNKKQIDSSLFYIAEAKGSEDYMDHVAKKEYFSTAAEAYKLKGNLEQSRVYSDSLKNYKEKLLDNNLTASFEINESLIESEEALRSESKLKLLNRQWIVALVIVLVACIGIFLLYYKKINRKLNHFINQRRNYSHLSSNYEKLKIKTLSLEEYISDLKKEIKSIASIDEVREQRQKIRELYKSIHLESSTLISNGENHLKLINELNIEFFTELKTRYPKLNESETIICYYLAMGFKNKEIALFLNRSLRAIESKRYRISKKVGLDKGDDSLSALLMEILKIPEQASISEENLPNRL
jgi:DNA-binding CsgD family transcriptional regulator